MYNKWIDTCRQNENTDVKVQMQRLHMSSENQDMVRDMLKNLREQDEEDPER